MLRLPGLTLSVFLGELSYFAGLGCISLGVMLAIIAASAVLHLPITPDLKTIEFAMIAYLIAAHAWFVLVASRAVARRIDAARFSGPLPVARWPLALVALAVPALGIAAWMGDRSLAVVLGAAFVLTPLVPALALNRSLGAALLETLTLLPRFVPLAAILAALPLAAAWQLGDFVQSCEGECWGLFEGGAVGFPLLALSMFLPACTVAVVPTAVYAILTAPPRSTASAAAV